MTCACGVALSDRNKTGRCRKCSAQLMGLARRKERPTCHDCGKVLAHMTNKSGRCGPCGNRFRENDPAFKAKRVEGIRRKFDDPKHRAKMAIVTARTSRMVAARPGHRERVREHMLRLQAIVQSPEVRAITFSPECRARAGKSRTDTVLAWCPPEHRDEYRRLIKSKRLTAAEARQVIENSIAAEEERLSPFERQLRAIERGATLIPNYKWAA